jgi:putative inorganic carbon (hco3(-)) transporter
MNSPALGLTRAWGLIRGVQVLPFRTIWLVAIVLLIPLEVSKTLFPIQQVEFSRILMAGAIAWEVKRVAAGARPVPRVLAWAIAAVTVVVVGSEAWTQWPEGLLLVGALVAYVGFFVFVADAILDWRGLAIVGASVVGSAAAISVLAIVQRIGDFYVWREGVLDVLGRANATFGDPNILARFLDFALAVALGLWFVRPWTDRRIDFALWVCTALLGVGLVQTQSRVGWLLLAFVLVPWIVVSLRRPRVLAAIATVVLASVLATAANSIAVNRVGSVLDDIGRTLTNGDGFAGGQTASVDTTYAPPRIVPGQALIRALPLDSVRLYLLEAGVAMWQDHPLFGVGTGGFQPAILGEYRGFIPGDRLSAIVSLPHTSLAQVAAENGWVGLASLFALVVAILALVVRSLRDPSPLVRAAAYSIAVAIGVIALGSQMEGRLLNEPYLWLALGCLAVLERLRRRGPA